MRPLLLITTYSQISGTLRSSLPCVCKKRRGLRAQMVTSSTMWRKIKGRTLTTRKTNHKKNLSGTIAPLLSHKESPPKRSASEIQSCSSRQGHLQMVQKDWTLLEGLSRVPEAPDEKRWWHYYIYRWVLVFKLCKIYLMDWFRCNYSCCKFITEIPYEEDLTKRRKTH